VNVYQGVESMTGIIAQLIALVSYGNEFFATGNIANDYFPANSTFTYCNTADFRIIRKRFLSSEKKESVVAENPLEWFRWLKVNGCQRLRLSYKGSDDTAIARDYKLAGFVGGGGTWLLEAVYPKHRDCWANRWEVNRRNADDRKIWSVNYRRIMAKQPIYDASFDIRKAAENLEEALIQISSFARRQHLNNGIAWAGIFEQARQIMRNQTLRSDYFHQDLIVNKNYSLLAQKTIFSAASAWVFGGMGSWNDLGFESEKDQLRYEDLSAQLYKAIIEATITVINSY